MAVVYHIPEHEKVGATTNFERRMKQQGLEPKEEYIKFTGSVEECSFVEDELRKFYKYPPDSNKTFIEMINPDYMSPKQRRPENCRVHPNTFNVGWNAHPFVTNREELLHDMQRVLEKHGSFTLGTKGGELEYTSQEQLVALSENAQKSHKGGDFFWNHTQLQSAYQVEGQPTSPCKHENIIPEFQQIRDWATERGLLEKGDPVTQMVKLMEELGETAKALLKPDGSVLKTGETKEEAIVDGLGDCLVVLINLSAQAGYNLEDCLASAYEEISARKGKMINGTFVKETL